MSKLFSCVASLISLSSAVAVAGPETPVTPPPIPNLHAVANPSGAATTYASDVPIGGQLDIRSPFFQSFGTNDRSCFACHAPRGGWTITPTLAAFLFDSTGGTDPMFRPVDGATSPTADVGTLDAKRTAYALLLAKGLIRVGMTVPDGAEFSLAAVDDPYHYASAAQLSLFRRPLPSVNLKFLSQVMWDGRQSLASGDLATELGNQADDATRTHAQATSGLSPAERGAVVGFESAVFLAQGTDTAAGDLTAGTGGGPVALAALPYSAGMNAPFATDHGAFDPNVFTLYASWLGETGATPASAARARIARGEALFNTKVFTARGVPGLNDAAGQTAVRATCSTCHNTPNVGTDSSGAFIDLGLVDADRRTADLPLYTLVNRTTGEARQVTDPGRALVSGRWSDIGRFKVPGLRALAARAPYFHNGSAATLAEVVAVLDQRFQIGLTPEEQSDLAAFLAAL